MGILAVSWLAVVSTRNDGIERQDTLADEARGYIEDKVFVKAAPLLEEAAGIKTDKTYELQLLLKDTYYNLGEFKKYYALLESLLPSELSDADMYLEAADYQLSVRKYKNALAILLEGHKKTNDERLISYYEANRYRVSKLSSKYQYISEIVSGAAIVQSGDKWGIASKSGAIVIPCEYDKVSTYAGGVTIVSKDGEIYAVNLLNQRTALLKKEGVTDFTNLSDSRLGLLISGKWIKSTDDFQTGTTEYEDMGILSDGHIAVKENGRWGVQNKSGEYLIPAEYEEIKMDELGRCMSQGSVFLKKGGAYYLYNKDGIQDTAYDDADIFNTSYAAVKKGDKWGFIDNTGKEVLPFEWDGALSFGMHLAAVKVGDKWGYIDLSGNIAIEPAYHEAKSFYDGYAPVLDGERWIFIVLDEYRE